MLELGGLHAASLRYSIFPWKSGDPLRLTWRIYWHAAENLAGYHISQDFHLSFRYFYLSMPQICNWALGKVQKSIAERCTHHSHSWRNRKENAAKLLSLVSSTLTCSFHQDTQPAELSNKGRAMKSSEHAESCWWDQKWLFKLRVAVPVLHQWLNDQRQNMASGSCEQNLAQSSRTWFLLNRGSFCSCRILLVLLLFLWARVF